MTMPDTIDKADTQSGKGVAGAVSTQAAAPEHDDRYHPAEIEVRWQQRWAEQPELYRAEPEGSAKPERFSELQPGPGTPRARTRSAPLAGAGHGWGPGPRRKARRG